LYGYPPPQLSLWHPPSSSIDVVGVLLCHRHRSLIQLRDNLLKAQHRRKKFADQHRIERKFNKDDWIYLKVQPYRQISISCGRNQKLAPHFYGPFEVEDRVGNITYRLRLPVGSAIHPVFQVSQLKYYISQDTTVSPTLLILSPEGILKIYPEYVLARHSLKHNNEAIPQILVKRTNLSEEDASWEDFVFIHHQFSTSLLEDKQVFEGRAVSNMGVVAVVKGERVIQQWFSTNKEGNTVKGRVHDLNEREVTDKGPRYSSDGSKCFQID
jgi:hypothetical protein